MIKSFSKTLFLFIALTGTSFYLFNASKAYAITDTLTIQNQTNLHDTATISVFTSTPYPTRVEFYRFVEGAQPAHIGSFLVDTSVTPLGYAWRYAWDTKTLPNGTYTVFARMIRANSTDGQIGGETPNSTVYINNQLLSPTLQDTTPPTIYITTPQVSAPLIPGQTITISASAYDADGISKVEFTDGTILKYTDTSAPYEFNWTPDTSTPAGQHIWHAIAYDIAGNHTASSPRYFYVSLPPLQTSPPPPPPTIVEPPSTTPPPPTISTEPQTPTVQTEIPSSPPTILVSPPIFPPPIAPSAIPPPPISTEQIKNITPKPAPLPTIQPSEKPTTQNTPNETRIIPIIEREKIPPVDSDGDTLSDFDEKNIYKTDPAKADSNGNGIKDAEELIMGKNATSNQPNAEIIYQPPEQAKIENESPALFSVETIKITKINTPPDQKPQVKEIMFSGKGPKNTIITLYIYSNPIIVTVKTNADGSWSYTLDKELTNGKHEIHVAVTDTTGVIVAKSSPIPFVKTAQAVNLGSNILPITPPDEKPNFYNSLYFWAIVGLIFMAIIVSLIIMGRHKNDSSDGGPDNLIVWK